MKATTLSALILGGLIGLAEPLAAQGPGPAGCWTGTLFDGAARYRAAAEFAPGDAGWRGALHALARELRTDSVRQVMRRGDSLSFSVPTDSLRLAGAFGDGGAVFQGQVTRAGRSGSFRFTRIAAPHPARRLAGYWSGALEQGGAPVLRIALDFAPAPCGDVLLTMDSPDQGVENLRVTDLAMRGDSLRFEMTYLGGAFVGAVTGNGDTLRGRWSQGGGTLDFRVARGDSAMPPARPQEPKPPFPYEAVDVTFRNADAGITLAGTLTIPAGDGPFPAAVLLSGSGAQDRDESLMGHRPFLVLADHLTRRGIAVLRFDDRGVGGSGGNTMQSTISDNAGDALAAVRALQARPEVDPARIGLIGHSEGGWVAPLAATRSSDVKYIVLLAGPGVSGEDLLHAQTAALYRAEGVPDDMIGAYNALAAMQYEVIRQTAEFATAAETIAARRAALLDSLPPGLAAALDSAWARTPPNAREAQLRTMLTPWFRYLLDFDPRPVLRDVRVPVLAVIGEKDLQVPPVQNIPALKRTCRESRHPDCTVEELPGLNHLFQHAETGRIVEYGRIEETMAPQVLELVATWITRRTMGGS